MPTYTIHDTTIIADKPADFYTRSGMRAGKWEDRVWNVGGRPDPYECKRWARANASASMLSIDIEPTDLRISAVTRLQATANVDFYIQMLRAAREGVREGGGNALIGTYNFPCPACQNYWRQWAAFSSDYAAQSSLIELDEDFLEQQMERLRPWIDCLQPSCYSVFEGSGWQGYFDNIIDRDAAWCRRVGFLGGDNTKSVIPFIHPRRHPSNDPTSAYLSNTDRDHIWDKVIATYGTAVVWTGPIGSGDTLATWANNLASGWPNKIASYTGAGGW